jgi:muramoyltetrapeptide carboxypeptidase
MISRRDFALFAAALAIPGLAAAAPSSRTLPMKRLIKPPRLRKGDLVGVIAPGGHIDDTGIERAIRNIETLGFKAKLSDNLRAKNGNYAGSVGQRISDLHAMFVDPEIKALWAVRGGSGCISLLSSIDYGLIRRHPKVLLGYSDITALHLALHRHAGLVSFHGPVASSGASEYSHGNLLALLCEPEAPYTIPMALENSRRAETDPHYGLRTVHGGQASGPLMGGNLSLVAALCGTAYAADFRRSILFLEEVNEPPYKMDRMMEQLNLSVGFAKAAAVMIGICDNCGPHDKDPSLTLDETLDIHLQPLAIPAVTGFSFGHIRNQFTIPMGIKATLDADRQTLTLLETAVS